MEDSENNPKIILIVSGKRKSGKDYFCNLLLERLGNENAVIIRLSAPIKLHWAKSNNLNLEELMGSGSYKEIHRKAMIEWGESVRRKDSGYFCRAAIELVDDSSKKPVWIISDARRKTDVEWFNKTYKDISLIKTVKIFACERIRESRGWTYEKGVDDAESECGLDSVTSWDYLIANDNDGNNLDDQLLQLVETCKSVI